MLSFNFRFLIIILLNLSLLGCVKIPVKLGIRETDWAKYTKTDKSILITNYKIITKSRDNKKKQSINVSKNKLLRVTINGGHAMMPPFFDYHYYVPAEFAIFNGQCMEILLNSTTSNKTTTKLTSCFYGRTLYIDPSNYDINKNPGSISIYYSPLWPQGFTYKNVSSSGYVSLKHSTITIKQLCK